MEENDQTQKPATSDLPLEVPAGSGPAPARTFLSRLLSRAIYIPLIMVLVFTGGVLGMYFQPPGLQKFFELTGLAPGGGNKNPIAVPVERQAEIAGEELVTVPTDVVALGKLLPKGDIVKVSPPFGSGDARVSELKVSEGDRVNAGDTIAVLDNLSTLQSRVESAKATVGVREATLRQTKELTQTSQAEASAQLRRAQSILKSANDDLARTRRLFDRGIVSKAAMDKAEASATQAREEVERIKATLNRFTNETTDNQADVIVALKNLEAAKAELDRAEFELAQAYVRAPLTGTILKLHVRAGEKPGSEGIADIGNIEQMAAEVEVYQTLIGRVEKGQRATLNAIALEQPLTGVVTRIGLEVGRQTITEDDRAANVDARVVTVTVELDEASSILARRFTNLEVVARIHTEPAS